MRRTTVRTLKCFLSELYHTILYYTIFIIHIIITSYAVLHCIVLPAVLALVISYYIILYDIMLYYIIIMPAVVALVEAHDGAHVEVAKDVDVVPRVEPPHPVAVDPGLYIYIYIS